MTTPYGKLEHQQGETALIIMSFLEQERLKNIELNKQLIAQLGIDSVKTSLSANTEPTRY